ncbi:Tyrosine-protein kinase YwqD [Sporotomaculum syntrophicum]|uniref:non-specific protein-tyrosine kinase n=1 Tax=Sporotomaculum syntrophicum TaxID=182264 RepID=A0A9D2WT03_9FIRM|nr:CpsD/CapB family tyrosine-protein kinase [Sporotomaculum syntrophicum]KAF1086077.1 Tyrosine-protein kinase YwqD [Sporotomaculum syntrophicum]
MADQTATELLTTASKSPFAEAFRTLRTNINYASLDEPYQIILVTSAGPGEGKTTVTSNLGVVMAQVNKKVLIIDCDLRRPSMHKVFGLNSSVGVTQALINDADPKVLAQKTQIPGLYVLTSGPIPPNPAELMGSQRMQALLSRAVEGYDFVLVDSPPVNMVTDAVLLSSMVSGVLMVVQSGDTRIDHAKEALNKLNKVDAKMVGVILNDVDTSAGNYYYYNYYYYSNNKPDAS